MNICSICHENINHNDEFFTKCYHCFHYVCFLQWKNSDLGISCPICRSPIRITNQQFKIIYDDLNKQIESAYIIFYNIVVSTPEQRKLFKQNAFKSILDAMNLSTHYDTNSSQFIHIYKLTQRLDNIIFCI